MHAPDSFRKNKHIFQLNLKYLSSATNPEQILHWIELTAKEKLIHTLFIPAAVVPSGTVLHLTDPMQYLSFKTITFNKFS